MTLSISLILSFQDVQSLRKRWRDPYWYFLCVRGEEEIDWGGSSGQTILAVGPEHRARGPESKSEGVVLIVHMGIALPSALLTVLEPAGVGRRKESATDATRRDKAT